MQKIEIDLKNVNSKEDILKRFDDVFKFEKGIKPQNNWDAFIDVFRSLDSDSILYKEKMLNEKKIHVILKNAHEAEKNCSKDYQDLLDTLTFLTNKKERYDNVTFTFSLR